MYLNYLGRIGTGDVLQLQKEIEEAKKRESSQRAEGQNAQEDQGAGSGMIETASLGKIAEANKTEPHGKEELPQTNGRDAEGDVKMDGPEEAAASS